MKKSMLWTGKILVPMLLALILSIATVPVETALHLPLVAQTDSATSCGTLYFDPPTIDGTAIGVGNTVTVNLSIRDADEINGWQAGLKFKPALLQCLEFKEGEFLDDEGTTTWYPNTIDNTAGEVKFHICTLRGLGNNASGDGRLAYLKFKVKALGVSDLHLRGVKVSVRGIQTPSNIIDVYTVVLGATRHTVVTVSDSTGLTGTYLSGFYDHSFNQPLKELSFKVTGPYAGFSNVTIPKTLLNVSLLDQWAVIIDGNLLSTEERIVTPSATNHSIYFTYSKGTHKVKITTRITSTVFIALSSESITLTSNVTISGNITADDPIDPLRPDANVTIQSRPVGAKDKKWDIIDTVKTGPNSNYNYTWTPETGGTHEVMANWTGDDDTVGAKSDVLALIVLYVFKPLGIDVVIETNSTVAEFPPHSISAFDFNQTLEQVSFNVTSPYGTTGYCNATIPKVLLNASTLEEWKVIVDGERLSTEERIVTENTNTSIYFTYEKGNHTVQITTRIIYNSTVSISLSSTTINLGSSVTISGNITTDDPVNPLRPYAAVTIHNRTRGTLDWGTLTITTTYQNGSYSHDWTPKKVGAYEIKASWKGDDWTLKNESEVKTLTVMQNSTISIDPLSSESITLGSNVTISGAIDPLRPIAYITIWYRLSGGTWDDLKRAIYINGSYSYIWTPEEAGAYEIKASWDGDDVTLSAESEARTLTVLKKTSTISIILSSASITLGESVTISGNVTAEDLTVRSNVNVTISYKLSDAEAWTPLVNITTTNLNGSYSYIWTPEEAGAYEIKASWDGDDVTLSAESEVKPLTVKEEPVGIDLMLIVAAVVVIIIIAAIAVYFIKFRKPK